MFESRKFLSYSSLPLQAMSFVELHLDVTILAYRALATRGSRPAQIIDGRIVDPLKLAEVLDRKFGKGNYDVEVRLRLHADAAAIILQFVIMPLSLEAEPDFVVFFRCAIIGSLFAREQS